MAAKFGRRVFLGRDALVVIVCGGGAATPLEKTRCLGPESFSFLVIVLVLSAI